MTNFYGQFIGFGAGGVAAAGFSDRAQYGGENYGFTAGGDAPGASDVIDKFSLSSDLNATTVGTLTDGTRYGGSCGSSSYGYCLSNSDPATTTTHLEKWAFASVNNGTNVADLPNDHNDGPSGHASLTAGYAAGGYRGDKNYIDKFLFAAESTTTDVGNLTVTNHGSGHAGVSAYDHGGYAYGGYPNTDVIDKFAFASDGDATDWANLTAPMRDMNGQSGTTYGYAAFGYTSGYISKIQKFPYASQTDATDIADITYQRGLSAGTSSTTHGYSAGGTYSGKHNRISKNSHAADGNEVDVADLTVARSHFSGTGTQY